jgi:hypothetical protein
MTVGQNIAHYKIIQKLGEPACRLGKGGPARRSRHNYIWGIL